LNVNLSALHAAANGGIEPAYLILKTMHGKTIGLITQHIDLQLELKFIDDSKISFKIPAYDGEEPTALYDELISMRKIEVPTIGTFVLDEPKTEGDGLKEVKEITGYSEERVFANRDILLEQGTYRLYSADDLASETPTTIMGIAHRLMPKWSIWVDESLYNKYRTFDNTKTGLLGWLRGTAAKAYGCLFNFDSATKTLYVLDANKEYRTNPIYLSYDNLLKKGVRTEYTKEFLTVLNVYGADPVNIREVNPIGSNKIYNLDYFIEIGDIPEDLSNKWRAWQAEIVLAQNNYTTMQLLRNAEMMRRETLNASKRDLEGEATDIENRISVVTQELALTEDEEDKEELQDTLEGLVDQKAAKQGEIDDVQDEIDASQDTIDEHNAALSDIVAELSYNSYFTAEERSILDDYFIEGDFTDETFAVFDVDISGEQDYYEKAETCTISVETDEDEQVEELDLSEVDPGNIINKRVIRVSGGVLTAEIGNTEIEAKILSGTVERDSDTGRTVCSFYTGAGNLTKSNSVTTFVNANVNFISSDSTLQNGDNPLSNAVLSECSAYFTKNKTQFESYAVQQQLFDHAAEQHRAIAYPTCEFDIESGNVIYAEEFEPFKDVLRLGEGVYLDFGDGTVLTPLLLEMHFSFDDPSKFDLIFSNSYSRSGSVKTMKDLLAESHVSARTLEMSKYNYGAFTRSGAESEVSKLFTQGLDAATKQILAGVNNSVVIDGSGITIRNPDDETVYLKMNNGMFAFMDGSDTAKLAIGKFYDTGMGQVMYGIVAPNIVGTLLAGENLIIQSPKFDGTNMYFSVDADGVRLANGQFDIYKISSQEGLSVSEKSISIDPNLGILGGDLDNAIAYDQNGAVTGVKIMNGNTLIGTVTSIADAKANYTNSIQHLTPNFWLDLNGDAFFRGTIYATDGYFSGTVHATDGEFSGTLNAPTLTGTMVAGSGGVIRGARIEVGGANYDKFVVTSSGDVYLDGNIHMTGQIDWGDNTGPDSGDDSEFVDSVNAYMSANDAALLLMQRQLDGQIMTYFETYAPTLANEPASAWTTDALKDEHLGDMFYNSTTGYAYRFVKNGDTYEWERIGDNSVIQALALAAKAQDTADRKRRNFIVQPYPPYDVGDIWMNGTKILVCVHAQTISGAFDEDDWEERVAYTDDSVALAIAQGTYTGGAFIDGKILHMPIVSGGRLYGAISLQVGANNNNFTADNMLEYNYNFAVSQNGALGIGYNAGAQSSNYRNFYVDPTGNVWLMGNIHMIGAIDWGSNTAPTGDADYDALSSRVSNLDIMLRQYIQSNGAEVSGLRDRMVETYYFNYAPTLNNIPASEWTEDYQKAEHVGDLFFDKSTGYTYRFNDATTTVNGEEVTTYSWDRIEDSDITEALSAASELEAAIDGHIRHFVTTQEHPTPYPPYDEGDLWTDGVTMYTCIRARTSNESYSRSDWANATALQKIVGGDYDGHSYIDGVMLQMPIISGGDIYGAVSLNIGARGNNQGYNFVVDQYGSVTTAGDVTLGGNITLSGNITWGTGTSPTQVVYAETQLSKPIDGTAYSTDNFPLTSSSTWHRRMSASDMYASYTYDGGTTWTMAVKIKGTDGDPATVTRDSIVSALRNATSGLPDGIYPYSYTDSGTTKYAIGINATYIKAGTIDANGIRFYGTNTLNNVTGGGGFHVGTGHDGNSTTYGAKMYGYNAENTNYIIATNAGVRMTSGGGTTEMWCINDQISIGYYKSATNHGSGQHYGKIYIKKDANNNGQVNIECNDFSVGAGSVHFNLGGGVVYYGDTPVHGSDASLKYDIRYDYDKYEDFFMKLKPSVYKLYTGNSGRDHTGFIANDIQNALSETNISTNEFAAYVEEKMYDEEGLFTGIKRGLRYTEFVSLNTYMIQKLYARIEELENRVALLSGGNE